MVDELLKRKAAVGFRNVRGATAAYAATAAGHVEVLRALLTAGAAADTTAKDGSTALHVAVKADGTELAGLLLKKGALIRPDADGVTPLEAAQRARKFEMLKVLGAHAGQVPPADGAQDATPPDAAADEDMEEVPQVVLVARVTGPDGKPYLVNKGSGVAYSNDMEDPQEVGTWSEAGGVVLGRRDDL